MDVTKRCNQCFKLKQINEFYKNSGMSDGRLNQCKLCRSESYREKLKTNKFREWQKSYEEKRRQDENRKEYLRSISSEYNKNNRVKKKAHLKVCRAKKKGIIKQTPCIICGEENTHAHHEDYKKPLDVLWLCPTHHRDIHRKEPIWM